MSNLPLVPRSVPDPGKPPTPKKTVERWDSFLGEIAAGTPLAEAKMKCYITNADIETMTRLPGGLELARWNDARLAARKRTWSVLEIEDICDRISEGTPVNEALKACRGDRDWTGFFALVSRDPDLKTMYEQAKEAGTLVLNEQITPIADDTSGDVLHGDKGPIPNNAAVQRARLRIDARQMQMRAFNRKKFGEKPDMQVNVQVINHAERLEEARNRATLRDKKVVPRISQNVIDAAFSEKPPAPAEWVDEKPMDTVWREES